MIFNTKMQKFFVTDLFLTSTPLEAKEVKQMKLPSPVGWNRGIDVNKRTVMTHIYSLL